MDVEHRSGRKQPTLRGRRLVPALIAAALCTASLIASAAAAQATVSGSITEFPLPTAKAFPDFAAAGPSAVWVTENQAFKIAEVSSAGVVTEFPVPPLASEMGGITVGPDGNVWSDEWTWQNSGATCAGDILRMSPAGVVTVFPLTGYAPVQLSPGADGNVWFTTNPCSAMPPAIGQITPAGLVHMYPLPAGSGESYGITSGPDGNLWFTLPDAIGTMTTGGVATVYPVSPAGNLSEIVTGPDGALWFTDFALGIGRITTSGAITTYPLSGAPFGIAPGPADTLVVTMFGKNTVDQLDLTATVLDSTPVPTASAGASQLVTGPDGNFWFAEQNANAVGRLTLTESSPVPTTVTVQKTPSVSEYGQSVTLTATVSPTDGGGTVSFTAQSQSVGCLNIALKLVNGQYQASCTTSQLPYGRYDIVADYSGDSSYAPSRGTLDQLVVQAPTTLTVKPMSIAGAILAGGPNASARLVSEANGQGVAGELVRFYLPDGTLICQANTNSSGTAACVGPKALTASLHKYKYYVGVYDGSVLYAPSDGRATISLL
jgi:virginiamycin B lyase